MVPLDVKRSSETVRAALSVAVVLGLLAACHFAVFSASDSRNETRVSASVHPDIEDSVSDTSPGATHSLTDQAGKQGLASFCGLLIACAVTLVGLGAMLMLRASRLDRVLWVRPAPLRRSDGVISRRMNLSAFIREPAALVC